MIDIIIVLGLSSIAMVFVASAFADIERNEDLKTKAAQKRNRAWHWKKAVFLGFLFAANSYGLFGITIVMGLFVLAQACLNVVIFNPAINLFKGTKGGFFYLSTKGLEGWFMKRSLQVVYYFGFLVVFFGLLISIYFIL